MPRRVTKTVSTQDTSEDDQQRSAQYEDQHMRSEDEASEHRSHAHSKRANATRKSSKHKVDKTRSGKTGKSRVQREAEDSDEDPEDNVVPFNKDEFLATARPISGKGIDSIGGLAKDWREVIHQVQNVGFNLVTETAVAVEEVSLNKHRQETINGLDTVMRQLIDAEKELTVHEESLKALQSRASSGEILKDLGEAYDAFVHDAMQAYDRATLRQKYAKHDEYFKFRERIWEVNHSDAMPPIRDFIIRDEDDSDDGSDVEVGGMTQDYKCPLTLTLLDNPVTSKLCKHSFSADAIKDYLGNSRRGKSCPATGCNKLLILADLEANPELAKRVAAAARRAKQREEDDDDQAEAEVID